ncbi:hypothetical protein OESDEN_18249 [Oesophagostomum dentatum]|uniref:Uncharacterized protein n=1 Tax=Oesophagostomum dentatum TaxID=61180 RepID=A0A0B1SAX2_OESDE|nr:hypothetical protein OESDEN_18249 [Oesophagostomum dentatum]
MSQPEPRPHTVMSSALLLILCVLNIAQTMSEPTGKLAPCSGPGATAQVPSEKESELLVEIFKREKPKATYSKHQMEKYALAVLGGRSLRISGLTTAYYKFMGYSGVLTVSPTTSLIALPGTNTNLNAFFTRNKRNGF